MCDFNNGFILCKCAILPTLTKKKKKVKKNEPETVKEYVWSLHRILKGVNVTEMGQYRFPVSDIGKGLTSTFVSNELNSRNCFDFDYIPADGDNLIINDSNYNGRIEFIYKENKWIVDHYNPFVDATKRLTEGKVMTIGQAKV